MARKTVGYVKLEWTCPNCSTRNPGPQKTCVNCGAPQPENVNFEVGADQELVKDENEIRAASAGADFICPYCNTRNRADAKVCKQCGGDLIEAKRRAFGAELQANTGPKEVTCTNCGTVNPATNVNCSKCGSPLPRTAKAAPPTPAASGGGPVGSLQKNPRSKWILSGALGLLAVCCLALIALFFFPTSSVQAKVTDVHWQTSVPVEEQHEVHHTDEEGSPPSDAYDVSCHTESKQVCEDKIIDQGNGYGQKVQDCRDVSTDYCSYTIKEWQTIQTYTLDGHDFSPSYSQPSIASSQRIGSESVDYTVYFDTQKGQKIYSPGSLDDFRQYQIGSTWTLKLNALGGVVNVGR